MQNLWRYKTNEWRYKRRSNEHISNRFQFTLGLTRRWLSSLSVLLELFSITVSMDSVTSFSTSPLWITPKGLSFKRSTQSSQSIDWSTNIQVGCKILKKFSTFLGGNLIFYKVNKVCTRDKKLVIFKQTRLETEKNSFQFTLFFVFPRISNWTRLLLVFFY